MAVVISGPSGAGKTTVCRLLTERHGYARSVSATTRAPRPGECPGVSYLFMSRPEFEEALRRGLFLEHSEHFDNLYGTPRGPVDAALDEGRVILLEIDVNGARQIMEKLDADAYCIFLHAPDFSEQERRLRGRHSENEASIRTRLQRPEIAMARAMDYDKWVENRDLEETVAAIHELIQTEVKNRHGR